MVATEIRLRSIREHEGTQARAWEELAFQLRPPVGPGHQETRKTRAPDGGVEWYEVYDDGHQEGFQAKFNECLADALGGMRESVKAICEKRPEISRVTFVVPYDFTDSGRSSRKSDQSRWDDAVLDWRSSFPGAQEILFTTIRAGDIVSRLALKEHAGRREYWFGGVELSDAWFRSRLDESIAVAGPRYTPEAHTASSVSTVIDGLVFGPLYREQLHAKLVAATLACRRDFGMWGDETAAASELVCLLEEATVGLNGAPLPGQLLSVQPPDVAMLLDASRELLRMAGKQGSKVDDWRRQNIDLASEALATLDEWLAGVGTQAMCDRAVALTGPAGHGKTHSLLRGAVECVDRADPALVVLSQRLGDKAWWPAVAETLGVTFASDEFLLALDSLAEARGCRALIAIDALNESQSPTRWQSELPALLAQVRKYPNLAVIVSYRTDYRDVIHAPASLKVVRHPGFSGLEEDALEAYCRLFKIPLPVSGLFETCFESPLFLRLFCELAAREPRFLNVTPSRTQLFDEFKRMVGRDVASKLELPPTTRVVTAAMELIADRQLESSGRAVSRAEVEPQVDALLPDRLWPRTLFQQMVSHGLIEVRPFRDGDELVSFPFEAYSEHLLARRLWERMDAELSKVGSDARSAVRAQMLSASPWAWRSLAILLPERGEGELVDLIPETWGDWRLREATLESLKDRATQAFTDRASDLLQECLPTVGVQDETALEVILSLTPREEHPGNADWLHAELVRLSMPDRDSTWSIATYDVDQTSNAYRRLTSWATRRSDRIASEEARLAVTGLMWLLTSPNRFLRDEASKTIVSLLHCRLRVGATIIRKARQTDDTYVQERVLTCLYGAVMVGGDSDPLGAREVFEAIAEWGAAGLPVDVIARDSARGIASWCLEKGLISETDASVFDPPYGAGPPLEPRRVASSKPIGASCGRRGTASRIAGRTPSWGRVCTGPETSISMSLEGT